MTTSTRHQPPEWMRDALCTQVDIGDIFFPDTGGSTREAKQICAACPVTTPCLQYALANGERFGVWGGKSERERRQLKPPNTHNDLPQAA